MAELGRLTAVFDADTRKFDAGARDVEKRLSGVTGMMRSMGSASVALQGPLGGVAGRLQGLSALSSQASSGVGVLGVGIAAVSVAIVGLAVALGKSVEQIYSLARVAMDAGGQLHDLSQQTNFSVETLSALGNAAETSGSSLEGITASLGIFQRHLESANTGTDKASQILKAWNVDLHDNEIALQQVLQKLSSMQSGTTQTTYALELFGRSGKQMLGILKDAGGDLEEFKTRMEEAGLMVSGEFAASMDKAGDNVTRLGQHFKILQNDLGQEFVPQVDRAILELTQFLRENRSEMQAWAKSIATVTGAIFGFRDAITGARYEAGAASGMFSDMALSINTVGVAAAIAYRGMIALRNAIAGPFAGATGGASGSAPVGVGFAAPTFPLRLGGGGGGGGRGGGGAAKVDPGVGLLKQLEEQFRSLTPRTEAQKTAERLLGDEYLRTSDKLRKKILITAMDIDQQKLILAVTRERYASEASLAKLAEEEFIKSLTRARRFFALERERFATKEGQNRPAWMDLGGGSTYGGEQGTAGRSRVATVEMQVMRERMQMIREQMMGLGQEVTSIFHRAVGDGFEGGVKRGLATMAQGLIDIVQNIFLKKLAEGLGNLFSDMALSGGGGFWGGLLKSVIGAAAGGAVGGGGKAAGAAGKIGGGMIGGGGFAGGGYLSAGQWGIAGERGPEAIYGGRTGMTVIPNRSGQVNNIHIHVPVSASGSYNSKRSRRQLAEELSGAVQGALS